ncbi:MAG: DNA-processing protein DprA [Acidimicrobiales bacterium]
MTLAMQQALLVLLSLPRMGPNRLRWIGADDDPIAALASLRAGRVVPRSDQPRGIDDRLLASWYAGARSSDEQQLWSDYHDAGLSLLFPSDHRWPFAMTPSRQACSSTKGPWPWHRPVLASAHEALLGGGASGCPHDGSRAGGSRGVGGQRSCRLASMGRPAGALAVGGAPPVAVAGTGLDHIYPRANRDLWERVARHGLLLSPRPRWCGPGRWRFPARNRLLAGLVDVLVVVESHAKGALLTVGKRLTGEFPSSVYRVRCWRSRARVRTRCSSTAVNRFAMPAMFSNS